MAEALRVGIAGLGTVGASVARVLRDKAAELTRQCGREIVVTAVSRRDPQRDRARCSFDACRKGARRLGYAEADPTFDIEGHDTAHKLSILTSLAFGTRLSADVVYMEGISNSTQADMRAAGELGYRIKLLGVAQKTDSGIEQRVHPTMVPTASVIAQVHGVTNAVAIETDILGELLLSGPGAGGNATASAVVGDIDDIDRK